MKKILFSLLALIVVGASFALYDLEYMIFPDWTAKPSGKVVLVKNPELSNRINAYFENLERSKSSQKYYCGHNYLGRDDRYAYIDLVCGLISQPKDGKFAMKSGYWSATRVELDGLNILGFKQPVEGTYHGSSYNLLFPDEIQKIDQRLRTNTPWNSIDRIAIERMKDQEGFSN